MMTVSTAKENDPVASRSAHRGPIVASAHETKLDRLLAALPDAAQKRWLPHLELVSLPLGHVLYESKKTEPRRPVTGTIPWTNNCAAGFC